MTIIYLNCNISDSLAEKENNIFTSEFAGYDARRFEPSRPSRMLSTLRFNPCELRRYLLWRPRTSLWIRCNASMTNKGAIGSLNSPYFFLKSLVHFDQCAVHEPVCLHDCCETLSKMICNRPPLISESI